MGSLNAFLHPVQVENREVVISERFQENGKPVPSVVFPDLESAELQKSLGVLGSDKVLSKLLYVGEFAALLQEVHELSGLDKDINDEVEEAKN